MRAPSQQCYDLIKRFEGYHRALPNGDCKGYPDPGTASGKPFTIGWGTTQYRTAGLAKYGRTYVLLSDTLTREQADAEFRAAVAVYAAIVNRLNSSLTQGQFDAAVSFCYNAGINTKQSDRLKNGDLKGFEVMLAAYNKGGDGKVLQGLVNRRADELALWRDGTTSGGVAMQIGWLALTRRNDKYILSAMDGDTVRKEHEFTSTAQLISLLRQYPEAGTTVVTKEEWVAPVDGVTTEPVQQSDVMTLVKTTTKLPNNLTQLLLRCKGKEYPCLSGQGYAQQFRKPGDPRSVPGNMEPIPQGRYIVGSVEWKGRPGDWSQSFGPGLGPVWVGLSATFSDDRGSFGIHRDDGPQGSAGCVTFTQAVLEELLPNLKGIRYLDVNWGL